MLGNLDLAVEGLGCYCISPTQPVKHQRCTSVLNPRCNDLVDILRHKLPSRIETDALTSPP